MGFEENNRMDDYSKGMRKLKKNMKTSLI